MGVLSQINHSMPEIVALTSQISTNTHPLISAPRLRRLTHPARLSGQHRHPLISEFVSAGRLASLRYQKTRRTLATKPNTMKKLLFSITLTLISLTGLLACGGEAVRYNAKFYLKDGSSFKGSFIVYGYHEATMLDEANTNDYCYDAGLRELLTLLYEDQAWGSNLDEQGRIPVYKSLDYLQPKPLRGTDAFLPIYGFVDQSQIVYLNPEELTQVIFWNAESLDYHWMSSELVTTATDMALKVQEDRYWNSTILDLEESTEDSLIFNNDDALWGYRLINYNEGINIAELKRLARVKNLQNFEDKFWTQYRRELGIADGGLSAAQARIGQARLKVEFQKIRAWFWERNVLVVEVFSGC